MHNDEKEKIIIYDEEKERKWKYEMREMKAWGDEQEKKTVRKCKEVNNRRKNKQSRR